MYASVSLWNELTLVGNNKKKLTSQFCISSSAWKRLELQPRVGFHPGLKKACDLQITDRSLFRYTFKRSKNFCAKRNSWYARKSVTWLKDLASLRRPYVFVIEHGIFPRQYYLLREHETEWLSDTTAQNADDQQPRVKCSQKYRKKCFYIKKISDGMPVKRRLWIIKRVRWIRLFCFCFLFIFTGVNHGRFICIDSR